MVTGIVVEMHFELQLSDQKALPVKCNAHLIHFERLAQDSFHVGVRFSQMGKAATRSLHTYLESIRKDRTHK